MNDTIQEAVDKMVGGVGQNPTVDAAPDRGARQRIPLSVPVRKLEVPDIPGYFLRWFKGTPQRLAQAERAGFEFVKQEEVQLHNVSLGGDATWDGNTDMGSRVSVVEGGEVDGGGQAVRLYLMKQKMEYRLEDEALAQQRNDSIADALTAQYRAGRIGAGQEGESPEDQAARYVGNRTRVPELFRRKGKR